MPYAVEYIDRTATLYVEIEGASLFAERLKLAERLDIVLATRDVETVIFDFSQTADEINDLDELFSAEVFTRRAGALMGRRIAVIHAGRSKNTIIFSRYLMRAGVAINDYWIEKEGFMPAGVR